MASIANFENLKGVSVFEDTESMSLAFYDLVTEEFKRAVSSRKPYHVALSGGSTPVRIFEHLSRMHVKKMNWKLIHIYWGDERCVEPGDPESNFGNSWNTLLRYIDIPRENIHRIRGEEKPEEERVRYAAEIMSNVPVFKGLPQFDMILLGIGDDGHTASLFPGSEELFDSRETCLVAEHPQSQQKRITLSMKVINNAKSVTFLVTGKSKAGVVEKILKRKRGYIKFPAANVAPANDNLRWFLDRQAAGRLKRRFIFL